MADIPTLAQLQSQIENDIRTELGITKTWVGKVMLRVLALVQAAKLKIFYLHVAQVQKNIFVDTATDEFTGGTLQRFGRVKLGRDPYPAVAGEYTLTVTGTSGGIILKGQTFKSSLGSTSPDKLFTVKETVTLVSSSGQIEVKALESGTISVLQASDELESTAPIANVNSLAVVSTVDVTAVEAENLEDYRELVIQSFQLEPQGGAATDYRIWATDATGVRTVYPYTKDGAIYTVQVFVEALPENSTPGFPEGTPPASMLTDVEEVIELDPDTTKPINERGRRPLQAVVEVLPVVPVATTITISDLSDKSAPVITAIESAIEDLFYTIRPYIPGADGTIRKDTLYISALIAAIFDAIDESISFSNVTITISSTVYSQYTFGNSPVTYGTYPYLFDLVTP
jgi:uncharacterized phage protein gp47/JayE